MMHPIRSLPPVRWHRYRDHLLRLDAGDRRLRFGQVRDDHAIARFVAELDASRNRILVFCDETLAVRGAVLISLLDAGGAELAFSIEQAWRRRGLGRDLAGRALLWLQNRVIATARVFCAAENLAMRRLARCAGLTLTLQDSECEGAIALPPPSRWSLLREAFAEQYGLYDTYRKANHSIPMLAPRLRPAV